MRVNFAGAGIARLCAAVARRHHGIDAAVLEQAVALSEVDAGTQIASDGTLVLREPGIGQA